MPDSLEAYKSAWSQYVPSTVSFSSDIMNFPVSNLTAEYINSHSVGLTWLPPINENIVGYYVYRNGEKVATVNKPTFHDTNLDANEKYKYIITGYTEGGEETIEASITVVTSLPQVKKIYTDNKLNKVGKTNGNIYALVGDSRNLKTASGKFYYDDKSGNKIQIGGTLTKRVSTNAEGAVYKTEWDVDNIASGQYTIYFEIIDADGEEGSLSETISVDDSRPEALSNVVAVGDTHQIVLSWTISHEIDTVKYYIYRRAENEDAYTLIKKVYDRNILTYTDIKASENQKYYYYVTGVNSFGQEGEPSNIAVATPLEDTELPRVIQLTPANGSIIGGNVDLYANAQDNIAVIKTELYLSVDDGDTWSLLKSVDSNYCGYTLKTAEYGDKTVLVKGLAYDASGNVSNPLTYSYKIDNSGPEKVTGLSYESTATTITLKWNDVADNDFSFFRLERKTEDGSFQKVQDIYKTLGVNIYNLESDKEYVYRVVAYDQRGNRGEASEELTARTQKDTSAPVITAIKPDANYYNKAIPLKITAKDNTGISSIKIQTSKDSIIWDDYKTVKFAGKNNTETASETIRLDEFPEGTLYIRGIATDVAGNEGDSSNKAPYVQYIVDRTAPEIPTGFNVNAITGAIELKWDMGTESDLDGYRVYRSTDGENYSIIAEKLHSVNYWDRSAKKDTDYWYKLDVSDRAGNFSNQTNAVKAILPNDTEKPKIESFTPKSDSKIGISNKKFSVMVSDNWKVDHVKVTYTVNDTQDVKTLINQSGIDHYYKVLNADIPIEKFNDGDTLHVTITVADAQGLSTSKNDITYTIDKTAPRVKSVSTEADKEKITVKWIGNAEKDLAGYRIYRKKASGSYSLIGQRSASDGTEYQYQDYNATTKETYYYKIEAIDKYGNVHAKESEAVWLIVEPVVTAGMNCDKVMESGVEYYFDAVSSFADLGIDSYQFDFGDGTVQKGKNAKVVHKYTNTGSYTITLSVVDTKGNTATTKYDVTVESPKMLGTVNVKAVDAEGNKITGMPVYFDLDNTSDNVKYTDAKGYVKFTASAGSYAIGAYADGFLPVKKSIAVKAGAESQLEITMVKEPIVTGEFEIDRMTLDEIIAAGIDTTDPANQQVVKVTLHLVYGSTPVTMNVVTNGKNIYSGETTIVDTDEGRRQLTASVVNTTNSVGGNGTSGFGNKNVIIAIMDVPVEASFLKEFFDVKLHIVNHADREFELTNNVVKLNVPKGMTLMDSNRTTADDTIYFGSLKGQEEKTLNWILRGDKAGDYDLEADYSGVLNQFNETVSAKFKTDKPIKVYGLNAIKLIADINSSVLYGGMYFDLSIQNIGGADMYLPSVDINEKIKVLYEKKANEAGYSSEEEVIEAGAAGGNVTRDVKLLDVVLKNSEGYKQNLGAKAEIDKLSQGETLTKKYVSYNGITTEDIAYLQKAVYQVAEDLDIDVEINMVDMDLYSLADAEEKKEQIKTDIDKRNKFDYILDLENKNFYYHIQALTDDGSKMKKEGEILYRYFDLLLEFDTSFIKNDDIRSITRGYIYEMLRDESFQTALDARIDDKWLKVTKSVVNSIIKELPEDHTSDSGATVNDKIIGSLSQSSNLYGLAKELELEGAAGFWNRLLVVTGANTSSVALEALKHSMETNMKNFDIAAGGYTKGIAGMVGSCLKKELGSLSKVLSHINKGFDAWNESVDITNELLAIQAGQEETIYLLDALLENPISTGNRLYDPYKPIYDEIRLLKEGMEKGFQTQADCFIKEFTTLELEGTISTISGKILSKLDKIYYGSETGHLGFTHTILKVAFGTLDYIFGWESSVKALESLRVAGCLTESLKAEVIKHKSSDGNADLFLKALKYLIKIRLIGEKSYVELAKDNDECEKVLKKINELGDTKYSSLDEYYNAFKSNLLDHRDAIYQEPKKVLNLLAAPDVNLDYKSEKTCEKFSSNYEYSFDGYNWMTGEDRQISLNPGIVGKHLWVRVKASKNNLAGNIKKLYIPSRPLIGNEITVKYKGGSYYIDGLPSAASYQLTNAKVEQLQNASMIEPKNGSAKISGANGYHNYMALTLNATNSAFQSQILNVKIEKAKVLTIVNDQNKGDVSGAGEYFKDEEASIKAVPKLGYEFTGWYSGDRLLSANPQYSFKIDNDCTIEAKYQISKKNRAVKIKDGSSVTINGSNVLTHGEKISSLSLGKAIFVDKATNQEVPGKLQWENPNDIPTVGTTAATWVFIPEDQDTYLKVTGSVEIVVKKVVQTSLKDPDSTSNEDNKSRNTDTAFNQDNKSRDKDTVVRISKVTISGVSNKIAAGKKIKLTINVYPSDASNKSVSWKSSNTKVATVDSNGIVTMKKNSGGKSVVITAIAKDGSGVKATYKINSMKGVVKKVSISGGKSVKAGKSLKLKAKVKASKKANTKIKWISSNTKYAKVNNSGKVTTYKAGKGKKVKITAMATDGSGKKKSVVIKLK